MASVRYIILAACQNAGLYAQAGWESEAAAWIKKQGDRPCAYVGYGRGKGVAGFDNVSVVFGGSDPSAALRRVRDSLERSLEFRSERQTEVDGFPALELTARSKRRAYGVFGGGVSPVPPTPKPPMFYFQAESAGAKVYMTSTMNTAPQLIYSTDGGENYITWNFTGSAGNWTSEDLTFANIGDKIYIQGENEKLSDTDNLKFSTFKVKTGYVIAGGSVQTLAKGEYGDDGEAVCMARLFYYCDRLKAAPLLTATKVHANDYWQMFSHCTGLASLPDNFRLPAMNLGYGCYAEMFANCTALASLPEGFTLTATTLAPYCYNGIFSGCTSLTSLPNGFILPAAELENGCYENMFYQCTFSTSEDGEDFSFPVCAALPQTVDGTTYTTPKDLATWMGNTNGFY